MICTLFAILIYFDNLHPFTSIHRLHRGLDGVIRVILLHVDGVEADEDVVVAAPDDEVIVAGVLGFGVSTVCQLISRRTVLPSVRWLDDIKGAGI